MVWANQKYVLRQPVIKTGLGPTLSGAVGIDPHTLGSLAYGILVNVSMGNHDPWQIGSIALSPINEVTDPAKAAGASAGQANSDTGDGSGSLTGTITGSDGVTPIGGAVPWAAIIIPFLGLDYTFGPAFGGGSSIASGAGLNPSIDIDVAGEITAWGFGDPPGDVLALAFLAAHGNGAATLGVGSLALANGLSGAMRYAAAYQVVSGDTASFDWTLASSVDWAIAGLLLAVRG